MFPTFSHFLHYLFGVDIPLPFNTFGILVACAFIAGYWGFVIELKRKESLGVIHPVTKTIIIGQGASMSEIISNVIFGFIIGYKLVYALLNYQLFVSDAQTVLLSLKGNWWGGIGFAALLGYWSYWEKERDKLPTPQKKQVILHPYEMMHTVVVWAAIWGFIGAKIFDSIEHWDSLMQDPIKELLSFSGFAFYGGLICGTAVVLFIAHKNRVKPLHLLDTASSVMMLTYGIGRMGCHLSGDGDWGIVNLRPKPFSWLPDWLWAYKFPNNVAMEGIPIPGCVGKFCNILPQPVWPTSIYETIITLIIFCFIWKVRHYIKTPGLVFSIYLIFNGLERFLIEFIRVNTKYDVEGFSLTQAQIIATIFFAIGVITFFILQKYKAKLANY